MILTRRAFGASSLALGLVAAARPAFAQDTPPVVAAASDLRYAVEEIAAAFRAETGQDVILSFGSTGNFARQIREGAPFQKFMAADEHFVLAVARAG